MNNQFPSVSGLHDTSPPLKVLLSRFYTLETILTVAGVHGFLADVAKWMQRMSMT